jgi:flagellar basal-body rod modification protein FlgD
MLSAAVASLLTTATTPAATAAAGTASAGTAASKTITQGDFLHLFIAQLQNQDPLSPLDPDQMTAQLAQFSSLEQLTGVNTRLDQLSVLSQQGLLSLMGRQVAFAGDTVGVSGGAASAVGYDLDAAAARVVATVRAADGSVVRVQDLGGQDAGHHEFKFDGKDAKGGVVPDGQYHVEIAAAANAGDAPKQLDLTVRETVDGVDFSVNPPVLLVGGQRVPLDQIHEVRVDQQTGAGTAGTK